MALEAQEVLREIENELGQPTLTSASTSTSRLERIREMQREFRREPLGGVAVPFKKLVYWFTASAFDRQAKVVEALIDVVDDELSARQNDPLAAAPRRPGEDDPASERNSTTD